MRLNQALGVNLKPNEDLDDAGAGAMLPMSPMEALRTGHYHQNVTVMIGSNENDGLILTTPLTTDPSLYILYRYRLTSATCSPPPGKPPVPADMRSVCRTVEP